MVNRIEERIEVLARIKKVIVDYLNIDIEPDFIDDDSPLFGTGLGLDSIDSLELVVGLEKEFDVSIEADAIEIFLSVNTIADYILKIGTKEKYSSESKFVRPKSYTALRESVFLYKKETLIVEIKEDEFSTAFLSRVISGNDIVLEPSRAIYSLILDTEGRIIDFVYVMMFDGSYRIVFDGKQSKGIQYFLKLCEKDGIQVKIFENYTQLIIEGPYAWKPAKKLAGIELTGLSYLHFMSCSVDDNEYTVLRAGTANEYCFRFFIPNEQLESFLSKVKDCCESEYYYESDMNLSYQTILLASKEVRFPLIDNVYGDDFSPLKNDLKWMIYLQKESFVGKEKIEEQKDMVDEKCVVFICPESKREEDLSCLNDCIITSGNSTVGKVMCCEYSFGLGKWFGYAMLKKEFAFANLEYEICMHGGEKEKMLTVSTPLFLTKSSVIQME